MVGLGSHTLSIEELVQALLVSAEPSAVETKLRVAA